MKPALNTLRVCCPYCALVVRTPGAFARHRQIKHPIVARRIIPAVHTAWNETLCPTCITSRRLCDRCLVAVWARPPSDAVAA